MVWANKRRRYICNVFSHWRWPCLTASVWFWSFTGISLLQWCYMSVMASQITDNWNACSTACSGKHQRKRRTSAWLILCKGNPFNSSGFPSQRASNAVSVPMSLCTGMAPLMVDGININKDLEQLIWTYLSESVQDTILTTYDTAQQFWGESHTYC